MLFNKNNANEAMADNRPQILKDLDDFNTADTVNKGILGGILEEQWAEGREGAERVRPERNDDEPATERKPRETSQEDFSKMYAPLNSSIQELQSKYERQADEMRNEIRSLGAQLEQRARYEQQQQQQAQIDPNEYITHGHVQPLAQRQTEYERHLWQMGMRVEAQRAEMEWQQYKIENPDFNTPLSEVRDSFRKYVGNDYNKATQINWRGVFQTQHSQSVAPSLRDENARLKAEIEQLKKGGKAASTTRNVAPETQVSPSLRPSGRAVATVGNAAESDDVINLSSFRKGRGFKQFGRDLERGGFLGRK